MYEFSKISMLNYFKQFFFLLKLTHCYRSFSWFRSRKVIIVGPANWMWHLVLCDFRCINFFLIAVGMWNLYALHIIVSSVAVAIFFYKTKYPF